MLDRRTHDRSRAFAAGTIGYGRRGGAIDCVVRDLSEGGALLLVDEPERAPVRLVLASRGDARPARVVWRGRTGVGVAFDPAPEVPSEMDASSRPAGRQDSRVWSEAPGLAGAPTSDTVVSLDDVRRARAGDHGRFAERLARFVRHPR